MCECVHLQLCVYLGLPGIMAIVIEAHVFTFLQIRVDVPVVPLVAAAVQASDGLQYSQGDSLFP